MRVIRFAGLLLLACMTVSCRDGAAATTSTSLTDPGTNDAKVLTGATASVTIPAPNGFASTVLARGSFPDQIDATIRVKETHGIKVAHVSDPTQMVMARISIAPGGALPWHTHPGPALVNVAAGEITIVHAEGCEVRGYVAGSAFVDLGQGNAHVGFNPGAVETVLHVTYLDVPPGQSPLVPVPAPGC